MTVLTRFDPQPNPNGVRYFSDAEREEAYLQAAPFLLEQMKILLKDHGWKHNNCDPEEVYNFPFTNRLQNNNSIFHHPYNQFLFDIYKPMKAKIGRQPAKLILPKKFACFLDVSKANTWRTVFENPSMLNPGINGTINKLDLYIGSPRPISNIFYLLQVLAPGMLVIYIEYQLQDASADVKLSKVLPRASWIENNIETMSNTEALLAAANDRNIAFHEKRTARPQNNSRSLPGTDAVPAAAKDRKTAPKKESTARPQNNYSSLPGTDALPSPATAKDSSSKIPSQKKGKGRSQNNPPHNSLPGMDAVPAAAAAAAKASSSKIPPPKKKKKGRPQNNNSYNTPRYSYPKYDDYSSINQPGEYGMCDKDCGWCGRCILDFDINF